MNPFVRKTNQYLASARQLLKLSTGAGADAALTGAVLAFERSVVFYLLERITPHAGKGFEAWKYGALPEVLNYCQQHREHVSCAEVAALAVDNDSWLGRLAGYHVQSFAGKSADLNRAYFASDQFADDDDQDRADAGNLIARTAGADTRFDARLVETWLNEFVSLVERQRLENDEF